MIASSGANASLNAKLGWATIVLTVIALCMAIFYAPMDRVQGIAQRIYYFHVPMAIMAYVAFFVVLVASVMYLRTREMKWDRRARASVEIGVLFTTLTLITGSIYGKPIWNTWWTWDARLTSTLVLWFIYVGYIMLRSYTPELEQGARFGAVLGIVGFIVVPINYMSVTWWRTLHPEAIILQPTPAAPPAATETLLVSMLAAFLLYCWLLAARTGLEAARDENRELEQELATGGATYA
ncbi:MAG: heme exporter protein [Chloroflexota bacterium]|jgi:heme exporter protein C|nr:heme exporter protein [Chloroflexota bacterium]